MEKVRQKIVFIGMYSDPYAPGGNNLLWKQANGLFNLGYDIEIITWPKKEFWQGKFPEKTIDVYEGVPYLKYKRGNLVYHIISPSTKWGEDVPQDLHWNKSVHWAQKLLNKIKPDIVHQHYWKRMWFFMEASINLDIPLYYTVYDWGLPCRRQNLIMGNGKLCHLNASLPNCIKCCSKISHTQNPYIPNTKISTSSIEINRLFERWQLIANNLSGLVVTSPFARMFYHRQGINKKIIHEKPWFYCQDISKKYKAINRNGEVKIGFLGRIVPEKGLHLVLHALRNIQGSPNLSLAIGGLVNNSYARSLKKEYSTYAGATRVDWRGWIPNENLGDFFGQIDVLIVPSIWYDNSPTTIAEALAHRCPVICSKVASMTHLVKHNTNGLLFTVNNIESLKKQIQKFGSNSHLRHKLQQNADFALNTQNYCEFLISIYKGMPNIRK